VFGLFFCNKIFQTFEPHLIKRGYYLFEWCGLKELLAKVCEPVDLSPIDRIVMSSLVSDVLDSQKQGLSLELCREIVNYKLQYLGY
jgi:hypothetical protein